MLPNLIMHWPRNTNLGSVMDCPLFPKQRIISLDTTAVHYSPSPIDTLRFILGKSVIDHKIIDDLIGKK